MRIQIIGFGNIGKGLAKVLIKKEKLLKKQHDLKIKVVSITDVSGTARDDKGINLSKALEIIKNGRGILSYPKATKMNGIEAIKTIQADLVVEATNTKIEDGEPGMSHMLQAIKQGKHVVTSNKGPLALKFQELNNSAKKNSVQFKFEASVGGAMPIINFAHETLSGDKINAIEGILNGTTNYILTRMSKEEKSFEMVLREAQEMGIAESDPSYDIDGIDTACKLVILANGILGIKKTYKDVKTQGIRKITPEAVKLAKEDGYVIKLIGEVKNNNLEVSPRLVPKNHPLNVEGVLNVALLKTDLAGDITIVGKGAGSIETNSAILSDIISIWRTGI
tara:strand:- start:7329 stop:8336 length:1008 start_codon:yes stop_codon:yes gene_type:complete